MRPPCITHTIERKNDILIGGTGVFDFSAYVVKLYTCNIRLQQPRGSQGLKKDLDREIKLKD